MREIKFRGLSVETGGWIFGSLLIMNVKYYIHSSDHGDLDDVDFGGGFEEVIKESVGQFIGLRDKNGKDIYDGDIIKKITGCSIMNGIEVQLFYIGEIHSFNPITGYKCGKLELWANSSIIYDCEIIGNIHENNGDNL